MTEGPAVDGLIGDNGEPVKLSGGDLLATNMARGVKLARSWGLAGHGMGRGEVLAAASSKGASLVGAPEQCHLSPSAS